MWTRKELKTKAKEALKGTYWKAFLVSLVLLLSGGGDTGGINLNALQRNHNQQSSYVQTFNRVGSSYASGYDSEYDNGYDSGTRDGLMDENDYTAAFNDNLRSRELSEFDIKAIVIVAVIVLIVFLVIIAYRILIGYSLEVGSKKYYVEAARGTADMNHLAFAFDKLHYKNILGVLFYKDYMNFLWYLALIIPGIIKRYSYMMVPYLLADNPNINRIEALSLSRTMMDGEKFKTFVLELSFIGWYILGVLAFLIGVLFVNPYYYQTKAELYLALKNKIDTESGNSNVITENI